MIRVPAPGGRIAISTSHRYENWFGRAVTAIFETIGLRFFCGDVYPELFAEAGLIEVRQRAHGLPRYLGAGRLA